MAYRTDVLKRKTMNTKALALAANDRMRRSFIFSIDDDTIRLKTGRTWSEWTRILHERGARGGQSAETARYLRNEYEISTWWANTITARYQWEHGVVD